MAKEICLRPSNNVLVVVLMVVLLTDCGSHAQNV